MSFTRRVAHFWTRVFCRYIQNTSPEVDNCQNTPILLLLRSEAHSSKRSSRTSRSCEVSFVQSPEAGFGDFSSFCCMPGLKLFSRVSQSRETLEDMARVCSKSWHGFCYV